MSDDQETQLEKLAVDIVTHLFVELQSERPLILLMTRSPRGAEPVTKPFSGVPMAKVKPKKKPASKRGRKKGEQLHFTGTGPEKNERVHPLALDYVNARDAQRQLHNKQVLARRAKQN